MAIYKVINEAGDYRTSEDADNLVDYATSFLETEWDSVVGGAVEPTIAMFAMRCVTEAYEKNEGLRMRHSVLAFADYELITAVKAESIAQEVIDYYSSQYQIVAGVHQDTDHLHIHFAMNTTAYTDGHKYRGEKKEYYDFLKHINAVLEPYNISAQLRKHSRDKNSPNNHTESQDTDTIYHFYDEDDET